MLNAGAILSAGILDNLVEPDMNSSEKFDYIQEYFKVYLFKNVHCLLPNPYLKNIQGLEKLIGRLSHPQFEVVIGRRKC